MLVRTVRILAWVWLIAACSLILIGHALTWYRGGSAALGELFGPHIITNGIAVGLALAPAFFLSRLARGLEEKKRGKILLTAAALVVSVAAVAFVVLLPLTLEGNKSQHAGEDVKAREYQAQSIRVKDRSAAMYQYKDHSLTGPVGNDEIPESIQIGDAITINGQTIRAQHILVKEILSDIRYGGQVLGKTGDTQCVITESPENLPSTDKNAARDRLWIVVEKCDPIAVATH
jgi:hypothetical protein